MLQYVDVDVERLADVNAGVGAEGGDAGAGAEGGGAGVGAEDGDAALTLISVEAAAAAAARFQTVLHDKRTVWGLKCKVCGSACLDNTASHLSGKSHRKKLRAAVWGAAAGERLEQRFESPDAVIVFDNISYTWRLEDVLSEGGSLLRVPKCVERWPKMRPRTEAPNLSGVT